MRKTTIQYGDDNGTKVVCDFAEPETLLEVLSKYGVKLPTAVEAMLGNLDGQVEEAIMAQFVRAHRVRFQDDGGRNMAKAGWSADQIKAWQDSYLPGVSARPKVEQKPIEISVKKDQKSFSREEVLAMLGSAKLGKRVKVVQE